MESRSLAVPRSDCVKCVPLLPQLQSRMRMRMRERSGIYANVYGPKRAGHVTVDFRDNKTGYDKDVSLGLPSSSSKQAGGTVGST